MIIFCVSSVILQKLRNNTKFDFHFEEDEFFKALFMKIEISRNVVVNPLTLHNYQKEIEKLRKHVMKKFSGDKSSENSSENDDSEVPPLNDEVPEIPPLNYEDAPEVPPLNGNEEYAVKMLEFEVEEKEKLDEIPAHFSKAEEFFQNNSGNSFKSFKIVTLLFIVFAFLFVI
uniref:Uncharacterized protein n=1 Tax=Panagrolaimus superbus TaxID=310955 RepID=A0A914YQB6_9BILA